MGLVLVRHEANQPSGGQVTDIEIGAFQTGPRNPEQDALLPIIGSARKGDSIDTTIGDYFDLEER
jgi:hypothetical protein